MKAIFRRARVCSLDACNASKKLTRSKAHRICLEVQWAFDGLKRGQVQRSQNPAGLWARGAEACVQRQTGKMQYKRT